MPSPLCYTIYGLFHLECNHVANRYIVPVDFLLAMLLGAAGLVALVVFGYTRYMNNSLARRLGKDTTDPAFNEAIDTLPRTLLEQCEIWDTVEYHLARRRKIAKRKAEEQQYGLVD